MLGSKLKTYACAAALCVAPLALTPASAATPAEVHPGMTVVDPSGGTVGMIAGVKGDNVLLKTDSHELQIPMSSFTASKGKLLFAMTAAQLNAEADKQAAAAAAAVAVGAPVYGSGGTLAGNIEALDNSLVTIKLTNGNTVRIPRSGVGGGAKGAVLGVTTQQLNDLASQAGTPAPAADAPAGE